MSLKFPAARQIRERASGLCVPSRWHADSSRWLTASFAAAFFTGWKIESSLWRPASSAKTLKAAFKQLQKLQCSKLSVGEDSYCSLTAVLDIYRMYLHMWWEFILAKFFAKCGWSAYMRVRLKDAYSEISCGLRRWKASGVASWCVCHAATIHTVHQHENTTMLFTCQTV